MPRTYTTISPRRRRKRERWAAIMVIGLAAAVGLVAAWFGSPQPWETPDSQLFPTTTTITQASGSS